MITLNKYVHIYIYNITVYTAKHQSGQERRSDHTQEQDGLVIRREPGQWPL